MKFDWAALRKNKGIDSIIYNSYLKKVSRVKFSNGNWINFFYLADGTLWKRKLSNNDTWIYQDELILKNDNIYQLNHDEGRVVRDTVANKWVFEYDYRDIWGNLRVSFRDSLATPVNGVYAPPVVTQVHETDALGLQIDALSYENVENNQFKYQKQEKINDFGLNWNFFNFRFSDEIGKFWQIDPLSEKYVYNSPYALQENKFGKGVELEGLEMQPFYPNIQGELYKSAGINSSTDAQKLGKDLLTSYLKAYATVFAMTAPVEEVIAGGLGLAATSVGTSIKAESTIVKETVIADKVLDAPSSQFIRTETISGNQSSRTVGEYVGKMKAGKEIEPVKVREINNEKYVIDGHHRLEASKITQTNLKYSPVDLKTIKSYGYIDDNAVMSAAADATATRPKIDYKLMKKAAGQ